MNDLEHVLLYLAGTVAFVAGATAVLHAIALQPSRRHRRRREQPGGRPRSHDS